jgi:hypothetical protein
VDLAERKINYKITMDTDLPATEWQEWSTLFGVDAIPPQLPPLCKPCISDNDLIYGKVLMICYGLYVKCNTHNLALMNVGGSLMVTFFVY